MDLFFFYDCLIYINMVEAGAAFITGIVILTIGSILFALWFFKKYQELKAIWERQNIWPPSYNRCPDYWADLGEKGCQNVHNLGSCPRGADGRIKAMGVMKFTGTETPEGRMKACAEARACGITWEGVDNLC
jgi:hypothetical protein